MELFDFISKFSLLSALFASVVIIFLLIKYPQPMKVMNFVWPLTALWAGLLSLWAYFSFGTPRISSSDLDFQEKQEMNSSNMKMDMSGMMKNISKEHRPFWQKVLLSTFHCGAGCTLADIIGEGLGFRLLSFLGLQGIFWQWMFDYLLALVVGVYFQYAAIRPMMKGMTASNVFVRAFRIDFFSLTAWQIGMYAFSYSIFFFVFSEPLSRDTWSFWFIMQLAMCAGFILAYPVNWLLIKKRIKPVM